MPRPTCPRRVGFTPSTTYFKPAGTPMGILEEVLLGHDELEAIRLKNLVGLSQEQAALQMGVSQPTFHRLLVSAHQKLTDAVVNGKALKIEGGNVMSADVQAGPCQWRRRWGCRTKPSIDILMGNQESQTDNNKGIIVAITSADGTLEGKVEERFGRAKKILLYNMTTEEHSVIDNAGNLNAAQGVGIQVAQTVIRLGAKAVISGHFGPKAFRTVQMAGLEVYSATNITVREAIKRFKMGKLIKLADADVEPHWK